MTNYDIVARQLAHLNVGYDSPAFIALREMAEGLERIASCADAPDIDPCGDEQVGLHCGVEDRQLRDLYETADYGYTQGAERILEWAISEAVVAAQPQQHQPNPPATPVGDFLYYIYKIHDSKHYWFKGINSDGKREWTPNAVDSKLFNYHEDAERFIEDIIGVGQAGVRGIPVGC